MSARKSTEVDDPSIHRLEGSSDTTGGLIFKKPKIDGADKPQTSQLGLDKLAQAKREEKRELERNYRHGRTEETPTGGVSDSVRKSIAKWVSPYTVSFSTNKQLGFSLWPIGLGGLRRRNGERYYGIIVTCWKSSKTTDEGSEQKRENRIDETANDVMIAAAETGIGETETATATEAVLTAIGLTDSEVDRERLCSRYAFYVNIIVDQDPSARFMQTIALFHKQDSFSFLFV
jgi:hypothetical protein